MRMMIVKFVLCVLLLRSVSGEVLPLSKSSDSVARVIKRIFGINETVCIITDGIMIDVVFEIPNPKIIWNFNATQKLGKHQTVSNFIIQVNDSNSLCNVLKHLKENPVWNDENTVSGTFLIIICEIDKVFENLWRYNISNSVILVNGNESSKCRLYQSTPWSVENECGKKPNVVHKEDCQDGPTLIFKKGFRSYHGCPIRYRHLYGNRFFEATITELRKRYGVRLTGRERNLHYSPLSIVQGNERVTYGVEIQHFVWLMPLPKKVPPLKLYLIIFQEEVWIMVAVGFLITILFYVIISLCKRIPVNISTFGFINMEILSLTFWGSCSRIPDVTALRVLLLSYIFYCIVVQTGYTSNLIRVQTIPQFEPGINSIRELIKSNIPIYADSLLSTINRNHSLCQNAKKEIVIVDRDSIIDILHSIIVHNNQAAAIMNPYNTIGIIGEHETIHNKLIFDDSVLNTEKYVFALPKEHYLFDILNKVVTGLTENGFYAHHNRKGNELLKNRMQSVDYPTEPQVLKLEHVYGIFVIWAFCLGISFLVFILEIIVHKLQVYKSNTIKPITITLEEEEKEEEEEEEIMEIEYIA